MRRKLAAGNWKMNGLRAALSEVERLATAQPSPTCEIVLCPPATLVRSMAKRCRGNAVTIGAQDCHETPAGAHTGDISAEMLCDAGAEYVILGHSERRETYGETDALVRRKVAAAGEAGLAAIVCVGETGEQRDAGQTLDIIGQQLAGSLADSPPRTALVVAYEPIWAIGTGRVPQLAEIGDVHDFIRAHLTKRFGVSVANATRLLYGGSMTPANAAEIIQVGNVDGGLIGGASLKAKDFSQIIAAFDAAD